jgi:hypothetical protein
MHMDIFTTDHPLTSQPSWFDARSFPLLSFVCTVFVTALIITPLIATGLYFYFISDIGAEARPFPDACYDLAVGTCFSFVVGIVLASLLVLTFRLLARIKRSRYVA